MDAHAKAVQGRLRGDGMSRKKYVVESAFESISVQKIMQIAIDVNGRIVNWTDSAENIKELNSDYINEHFGQLQDEAYKRGYKEGEENGRKDGLFEAWELMKKIVFAQDPHVMVDILGAMTFGEVLLKNTPQEAIAKLKSHEEEKYRIHVGDEVVSKNGSIKFIVTNIDDETATMLSSDGQCAITHAIESFKRTGKRFDIQTILKELDDEN